MLKKILSFALCFNLVVTPVIAQDDTSLNSAFNDMNKAQLTDAEMKAAENFKHTSRTDRMVKEQCKGSKCDASQADRNASVLGGSVGVIVEQNIGKLYAVIFGAGGMLIAAITSAIGSTGGDSGAGAGVAALGAMGGGNKDGGISSYTVVRGEDGKKLKGKDAQAAKDNLRQEGDNKKNMRKGNEVTSKDGKTKTEKQTDWCAKIAIASEVTAAINQHIKQKKIQSMTIPAGDEQRGAIDMAKLTHDERRKTSLIQATGFAGVSACYGVLMFSKSVVVDQMMVVKMAAAATLSTLFYVKASKHKKASDELDRISKALPRDGSCNPYTDTLCFCAEITSEKAFPAEFSKVCVPSEYGPKATASSLTCLVVNAAGKYVADTACKCKETNSCFKANLSLLNPKFSLASNLMNQGQTAINAALSNNFDEGQLNAAYLSNSALNNRVVKAADGKVKPTQVSAANKKLADELSKALSPNIASQIASSPSGELPVTASSSMPTPAVVSPEAQKALDAVSKKVAYGEAGAGFGSQGSQEEDFTLPQIPNMGGEQAPQSAVDVLSFAEQAVENADISKAPETPIFDIISYRYRQSAWSKVEIKEDNAPAKQP
jgi:hypothetical protein